MVKKIVFALAMGAGLLVVPLPAFAWNILGSRDVASRVDRDSIHLDGHRLYSRIRICVEVNPVQFLDVTVTFNNGASQSVPVRARIPRGRCSRVIDLDGAPRDVSEINFVYENAAARWRNARVTVSGE
jgi:hypothetical protein